MVTLHLFGITAFRDIVGAVITLHFFQRRHQLVINDNAFLIELRHILPICLCGLIGCRDFFTAGRNSQFMPRTYKIVALQFTRTRNLFLFLGHGGFLRLANIGTIVAALLFALRLKHLG